MLEFALGYEELARRIYISYLSCRRGESYATVEQELAGALVGRLWLEFAELVDKEVVEEFGEAFGSVPVTP
jgi:hypothetical protein